MEFEKFLAKWAYCAAIKGFGLDAFEEIYVVDDILGKTDTIGTYVGCDHEALLGRRPAAGAYMPITDEQRRVVMRMKLFANSDAPEYLVVVGVLRPDASAIGGGTWCATPDRPLPRAAEED